MNRRHIEDLIRGQREKIARCERRIAELEERIANLPQEKPKPAPYSVPMKDDHVYCGKILYPSEKAAHAARKLINRDLKKAGKKQMRRAYFCKMCEAWHLTTIESWVPFPENEPMTEVSETTATAEDAPQKTPEAQ